MESLFIFLYLTSANKIEKSVDFVQSDEILRDVLFGARKSNITNETRSVYKIPFILFFNQLFRAICNMVYEGLDTQLGRDALQV